MGRFLCMPEPMVGESTIGFLLRFANDNGYAGLHPFKWPMMPVISKPDIRTLSLSDVAYVTGHPIRLLQERLWMSYDPLEDKYWYPFRGLTQKVFRDAYNFNSPRICAACVRESVVLKLEWELALMVACGKHRLLLQDRCPSCYKYLSWGRRYFDRCDCGCQMVDWDQGRARRDELEFQWLAYGNGNVEISPAQRWMKRFPGELNYIYIERLSRAVSRMAHRSALRRDTHREKKDKTAYSLRAADMTSCIRAVMAVLRSDPDYTLRMLHLDTPPKPHSSGQKRKCESPLPLQSRYSEKMHRVAEDTFKLPPAVDLLDEE